MIDEIDVVIRTRTVRGALGPVSRCGDLRKHDSPRLRFCLERRQSTCLGFMNTRVTLQSLLINLEQRGRMSDRRQRKQAESDR